MKTKYSYFDLRFPSNIALLCLQIRDKLNATYIDLPFLLPLESELCEYREANVITYENRKYYVADEKMDVCFKSEAYLKESFFGLINITKNVPQYVLWTTFYDEKLEGVIAEFRGNSDIRIYNDPVRSSVTLMCDDA